MQLRNCIGKFVNCSGGRLAESKRHVNTVVPGEIQRTPPIGPTRQTLDQHPKIFSNLVVLVSI